MSSRPVNALTLEEIHARENIQTTPTLPTPSVSSNGEELGAFNKLVAGLQSSGALHKDPPEPGLSMVCQSITCFVCCVLLYNGNVYLCFIYVSFYQVKPSTSQSSVNPALMSSTSVPNMSASFRQDNPHPPQNTFGSALEKEMEFEDEVITGSHPHYQRPPPEIPSQYSSRASRVEHLERMLEKLDQEQVMRDKHKLVPTELSPHVASGYPEQHMKVKLLQSHSSRMTRGSPMDGQRSIPMDGQRPMPMDGQRPLPMDGQRPLPMDGQRPLPMDGQRPLPMDGQRPLPMDGQRPLPMDGQRPLPMDGQRPMPMTERDYLYHEGEHRIDMLPPPNIGIRPQAGMNRSNHWAVEMERRRLIELKQMERVRMERAMYNSSMHPGMPHKVGYIVHISVSISLCICTSGVVLSKYTLYGRQCS